MPKSKFKPSIDFSQLRQDIAAQFRGLDPNDPSRWPAMPRYTLLVVLAVAVVLALWHVVLSKQSLSLDSERAQETQLRTEFSNKLGQAANLDALRLQLEQVRQYVAQLERQLPSRAEMDALLSDINQAGLGRSLQFELFRPGELQLRDYYAELPITIRVVGTYQDIGQFVSDISHLSRIVTINNIALAPAANRPEFLTMDATAKTFRYLDADELRQPSRAAGARP